ncbi:MAG: PAS domain-containing protein [Alphaproteobacteria bacterium]|jgi:hypothetical protein|nr:PAS domain-containing protein [Alphaproteobacteria bacterium]
MPEPVSVFHASVESPQFFAVESGDALSAPLLRALFDYWHGLRGDRPMPLFTELDPLDIPRKALPHVFLIDVAGPNRFVVRLQGTEVVHQAGVDLTGRFIHEIEGAEGTQSRFENLLVDRQPYYCRVPLSWSRNDFKVYETVVCPLADGSGTEIRRIFTGVVFS